MPAGVAVTALVAVATAVAVATGVPLGEGAAIVGVGGEMVGASLPHAASRIRDANASGTNRLRDVLPGLDCVLRRQATMLDHHPPSERSCPYTMNTIHPL